MKKLVILAILVAAGWYGYQAYVAQEASEAPQQANELQPEGTPAPVGTVPSGQPLAAVGR